MFIYWARINYLGILNILLFLFSGSILSDLIDTRRSIDIQSLWKVDSNDGSEFN